MAGQKYTYLLNLCGPLLSTCGNTTGAAACQSYSTSKGIVSNSLGLPAKSLTFSNGQLSITNLNGTAGCKSARQSTINFVCDPTVSGLQGPEFNYEVNCVYLFTWRTSLVCASPPQLPCVYDNQTQRLFTDFTPLRNSDFNWQFTDPATNLTFDLNVCQNLLPDRVCRPSPPRGCIASFHARLAVRSPPAPV